MKIHQRPKNIDAIILSVFCIVMTWQPYFMNGRINIFEVGLYLPGIQSVLNGGVPFRDVFHLRGPFELYMPAVLMQIFGEHLNILYAYFYFGSVLCLVLGVFIGKELYQTRYILYLMTLILIGRTFPRVVFTYWGGMRYAFGLMSLLFLIKFIKQKKPLWIFGAGILTACSLFTSIEMGIYPFMGTFVALLFAYVFKMQNKKFILRSAYFYVSGILSIALPFSIYLSLNEAFLPYLDSVWTVVTQMQTVINQHIASIYPHNLPEALVAMFNPNHVNFKHMTPSYLYIFLLVYLIFRLKRKKFNDTDLAVLCMGVYGFIMYNTAFRGIWAAQFEMALQPEKILYFFLIEIVFLYFIDQKQILLKKIESVGRIPWFDRRRWKIYVIHFLFLGLFCSTVGYSIARFNHRFFAFKFLRNKIMGKKIEELKPLANEPSRPIRIQRATGIEVPIDQAQELEQLEEWMTKHTDSEEAILMFPELGTYHFLFDKNFIGRFPMVTFSWFNDHWHEDFIHDFINSNPRFVLMTRTMPPGWEDVYMAYEPSRRKYKDILNVINAKYKLAWQLSNSDIYILKDE